MVPSAHLSRSLSTGPIRPGPRSAWRWPEFRPVLTVFLLGCVLGLALFSTALNWALEHHHNSVMAALTGLMIGSLRVLWPWPEGTEETALWAPGEQWGLALVIAVAAFVVVIVVSEISQRRLTAAAAAPEPTN